MLPSYGFFAHMETFLRLHLEHYAGALQKEFYMAKSEIVVYHLLVQVASLTGWATRKEKVSGAWLRCEVWEQAVFSLLEVWIFGRKMTIPSTICQILLKILLFQKYLWFCSGYGHKIPWHDLCKTTKTSFSVQLRFPSRVFLCNYYWEFKFASLNACQGWIKGEVE